MQRGWRTGGGNAIGHRNTEGTERFPNFKSLSVLSVALWQILFFGIVRRIESSTRVGNPCHCFVFSASLGDLCGSAFGLGPRRRVLALRDAQAGRSPMPREELPLQVFEVALEVAGAVKAFEDEGVLEAADDFFDHPGLVFVAVAAAYDGVEDLH